MKIIQYVVFGLVSFLVAVFVGCYLFFLFGAPKLFSDERYVRKYEKILFEKVSTPFKISNFELKTFPNLGIEVHLKSISTNTEDGEKIILANNIDYKTNLLSLRNGKIDIKHLYADFEKIKELFPRVETQESKSFNILKYYPITNIEESKIKFSKNTILNIDYIKSEKKHGKIVTSVMAELLSPYTEKPVSIGKNGKIIYSSEGLALDKFSVQMGNSILNLSGNSNMMDIYGKNLPVRELESAFLYFYKLKHPNKRNFIENFSNFEGTMDIALEYSKDGFNGNCITHNLGADFSGFKIPVYLPKTVFDFNGHSIKAETTGKFGTGNVKTNLNVEGIMTDNLTVNGNVFSIIKDDFTKKYYPALSIDGSADVKVNYHTNDGKVDVDYMLTLDKGANLKSSYGNLDNTDKIRRISMHTIKQGIPMSISSYDYSIYDNGEYKKILGGDGLFEKDNGRYRLSYVTLKSNGRVSVNYIKSFLQDYVKDGTFDADLKYNFSAKSLLGSVNLYDVSHSDFLYLKRTKVAVSGDKINLDMDGTFYGSAIKAKASANNDFRKTFHVYNVDIHLNSFLVQKGKLTSIPKTFKQGHDIPRVKTSKRIDVVVDNGNVKVDRIYSRKFDVRNVVMQGHLKNDIASFVMPQAEYANGLLSAKGTYNIANNSSDIQFFASDIDSNIVATEFFKLKDQVEGDAYATLHVKTKDKLNDIKAKATFAISDGFLPKIGSQEFIINSSKKSKKPSKSKIVNKLREKFKDIKITLANITNIDFSKPNIFYSNLYGSFNIDNEDVNDVRIFSKSDFLSLFIEGEYNIDDECGNLNIWGRRNKTEAKNIRIFKIPVNLIYRIVFRPERTKDMYEDKIKLIPEIKSKIADDIALFRVSVDGNLNDNESKLKVILKDLR